MTLADVLQGRVTTLESENAALREELADAKEKYEYWRSASDARGLIERALSEAREQLAEAQKALGADTSLFADWSAADRIKFNIERIEGWMKENLELRSQLEAAQRERDELRNARVMTRLTCPACGKRHIDSGEWFERPHRTHLCEHCGHTWRPYEVATVGVGSLPMVEENESLRTRLASAEAALKIAVPVLRRHPDLVFPGSEADRAHKACKAALSPAPSAGEPEYDASVPPIWETIAALGASIPQDEWDKARETARYNNARRFIEETFRSVGGPMPSEEKLHETALTLSKITLRLARLPREEPPSTREEPCRKFLSPEPPFMDSGFKCRVCGRTQMEHEPRPVNQKTERPCSMFTGRTDVASCVHCHSCGWPRRDHVPASVSSEAPSATCTSCGSAVTYHLAGCAARPGHQPGCEKPGLECCSEATPEKQHTTYCRQNANVPDCKCETTPEFDMLAELKKRMGEATPEGKTCRVKVKRRWCVAGVWPAPGEYVEEDCGRQLPCEMAGHGREDGR